MGATELLTAEEFADQRFDFPEAGQWSELEEGAVVHLQPPDLDHGNVVLNLSKKFSEHAHATESGYACFDLGLRVKRDPDTVWFPAACYFGAGPSFAESDLSITDTVPALVVELASTSDRRERQPDRSLRYLEWGVSAVWSIDPRERAVEIFQPEKDVRRLAETAFLAGGEILNSFNVEVSALFIEPSWWSGAR